MRLRNYAGALCLLGLLSVIPTNALAQDNKIGVGLGVGISVPHGVKLEAGVKFMPELAARAGFSFIPSILLDNRSLADFDVAEFKQVLGYNPTLDAKSTVSSFAGYLLVDYHPFKNGFRVSTGLYFGRPKMAVGLRLLNPKGMPITTDMTPDQIKNMPTISMTNESDTEKILIKPDANAGIDMAMNIGNAIQPYLGIGYGYIVPNSRVTFTCDLGALIAGGPRFKSSGVVSGDINKAVRSDQEFKDIAKYTTVLPVLNLGVNIRLTK